MEGKKEVRGKNGEKKWCRKKKGGSKEKQEREEKPCEKY